jgi:5'-3' exonuclease, N-terminal resolvase-like domain
MQDTNLILDCHNLLHRSFLAGDIQSDEETFIGMAYHRALMTLNKYARQYKAKNIVVTFDTPNSWRKVYTKDVENCITRKVYKANRRQDLTEGEKNKFRILDEHIDKMYELFSFNSGLIVLKAKYLEADDLIAGYTQKFKDDHHVIISSDKDFIQLLSNPNVILIDPFSDKPRDLSEWDNDARYFMFEKCIRGDRGDNVQSSYPNIREPKIKKAYVDEFSRNNIRNHTFVVEYLDNAGILQKQTYECGKLFDENELLMDLSKQPEYIRELIDNTIIKAIEERGKFDYNKFVKFLGKFDLNRVLQDVDKFIPLLSGKNKFT